jgi:hypothetical protein
VPYEKDVPLNAMLTCRQASKLPILNEFVKSYLYQRMMNWIKT